MMKIIRFEDIFGKDILGCHPYIIPSAGISVTVDPERHKTLLSPSYGAVEFDILALVYDNGGIIDSLAGYFTRTMEDEIIVDDPDRTLGQNACNKIRVSNIHNVDGVKFTCITLNTDTEIKSLNTKYVCRDTWPIVKKIPRKEV